MERIFENEIYFIPNYILEPLIFSKGSNAIIGPGDSIIIPKIGPDVDLEAELAIIIGRSGKNIKKGSGEIEFYAILATLLWILNKIEHFRGRHGPCFWFHSR